MKRLLPFIIACILPAIAFSQKISWVHIHTNTTASFRALSVVDDSIAWVSGTEGTIGKTTDGGKTWRFIQLPGCEKMDFRTIYAFDSVNVIIANAGSPTIIWRMKDGHNWNAVYHNNDSTCFIDGIDMWNDKDGIVYGDPKQGHLLILHTTDGGLSWQQHAAENEPTIDSGEASFAASGTGIRCLPNNKLMIATGGAESRLYMSENNGNNWHFIRSPILKGKSSEGIFSFACQHDTCLVVGGDYKNENESKWNAYIFYNPGYYTWRAPLNSTRGYRECVEFIATNTAIAVGPAGADITYNTGNNWKPLWDDKGYHVIRKSRKGDLIIAAGRNGQIRIVQFKK